MNYRKRPRAVIPRNPSNHAPKGDGVDHAGLIHRSIELDFDQPRHIQGDSSRASLRLDTDHLRLSMTHTKELFDETTKKMFGRFYGMIKSLNEFDSTKIRSVVQGQLNLSENEKCVFALYLRVAGNISSVIKLSDVKDFQAVIALSRMILELAVDVKLIADGSIENGVEKALGFHDIQRLRAAYRAIDLEKAYPDSDASPQRKWVLDNKTRVDAKHEELWGRDARGRLKQMNHWSGLDFTKRVQTAGGDFKRWHGESYISNNWHVHSGLAGFLNMRTKFFAISQARACAVIANCYREVLSLVIQQFELGKGDEDIARHLDLAYKLPWTDSEEQAIQLGRELLG